MHSERKDSNPPTRDRRVEKASVHSRSPLAEHLSKLMEGNIVRVGVGASCGGKVDPCQFLLTKWRKYGSSTGN
jgi:hypothetical protein